MLPWESAPATERKIGFTHRMGRGSYPYSCTKMYLKDSEFFNFRKGDIVKFENCRIKPRYESWQKWFMTKDDYIKTWKKKPNVPYYSSKQLAVIIARYKLIKQKSVFNRIFKDYGCVVMMLTGEKKGHIRHYVMKYPFHKMLEFPTKITRNFFIKKLPKEVVDIFNMDYENTEEGRNLLLLRLNSLLNEE